MITSIEIKYVKGIENHNFNLRLFPNKPNLLVAPNGYGKSSIATAFASMNSQRINLDEKDYYQGNDAYQPELLLTFEDKSNNAKTLKADTNTNEIHKYFDIAVIRSALVAKATKRNMGGFTHVSASLEIQDIPICKIPDKVTFDYQYSSFKSSFGRNGKILPNITKLLQSIEINNAIVSCDLSKTKGKRIQNKIANVIEKINQQNASVDVIYKWIESNAMDDLRAIPYLIDLTVKIKKTNLIHSEVEAFLVAIQIIELYTTNSKTFKNAVAWLNYLAGKKYYSELLYGFCNSNWQWPEVKEIKTSKKDKRPTELQVIFPKAHQLSNGQRDIITLVVHMHKILYQGTRKPLILIIDEVFDYLDDANLVAFQYYITSLIEKYKQRGQTLYPLILTHLDPGVFFDFCFNKHKIHTHYLQPHSSGKSANTLKLIEVRDKKDAIRDQLENHWFHYYPMSCDIDSCEWPNDLPNDWRQSEQFHIYTKAELDNYQKDKNFDPLAVCFAVRVRVEQKVYELLCDDDKKKFINTRKTKEKLHYASDSSKDIPESYFLLGLIYNTNLHWTQNRDYISPLVAKLNHPTIKRLIHYAVS